MMTRTRLTYLLPPFLATVPPALARVRCFSVFDCEAKLRAGSECIDGFCSNPYHRKGCLASHGIENYKIRTCTSADPPSAAEKGYCKPSEMGYIEVRISSQNWESVFFISWILQIILSEVLDVPVTIETGLPDVNVDFYDIYNRFEYGKGNFWDPLRVAHDVKDCRLIKNDAAAEYTACSHFIPEVWAATGHSPGLRKLQDDGVIEPPSGLGALGFQSWWTRRSTGRKHPELLTYLGLQGDEARLKLASIFKRPTTWADYCNKVSADGCQTEDGRAERAPVGEEGGLYYKEGLFKGYFMATEKNNCTDNPTCTGHIIDYPCGWASYVSQQAYHLGIPVESNGPEAGSNGYSYGAMNQIWTAADVLDEDVLMQWWHPEVLYQSFLGTESEFTGVALPPPTQDCVVNRISTEDRCSKDDQIRVGDAMGACAESPQTLVKVITTALYDISFDPDVPDALWSPAYDTVSNFHISALQIGKLFDYWLKKNNDKWGLDPRDGVCEWVIDNIEQLQNFIPKGHPRRIVDNEDVYKQPIFYVALSFACIAICLTLAGSGLTWLQRTKQAIRYAQIEFLFLILFGLMSVSIGALMAALPPTDPLCVAVEWAVNIGYTLGLVPLIVKVAAINRIMVAQQRMRRVQINLLDLFVAVAIVCLLVAGALIAWTVIAPPRSFEELKLTSKEAESGGLVVERTSYCHSTDVYWYYMGVSWQLLLMLCTSVLAFQIRNITEDLNESKVLGMMVYSHFVFVCLIFVTYLLDGSLENTDLIAARSILLSLDTIATLSIYFLPKFVAQEKSGGSRGSSDKETAGPLSVHKWQSRQHSTNGTPQGEEGFCSDGIALDSVRQSSVDYHTEAELDDNCGNARPSRLGNISEESSEVSDIISDEGDKILGDDD